MLTLPLPTALGLRRTFGFGDRLGVAGPGHLAAIRGSSFAPILAQQSVREMTRTQRAPEEVMLAAQRAIVTTGFTGPWGADGDHLKTPDDVRRVAAAGFTFYTIDPSAFVVASADRMSPEELAAATAQQEADGIYGGAAVAEIYLGQTYAVAGADYRFTTATLHRAAVKYGRAMAQVEVMARAIAEANVGRLYEIEVSVDETDSPTSPLEHLFVALELRRRGVVAVSVAPRFPGEFEKGIDYKGDLAVFAASLQAHADIAAAFGPYKISIHSGSDKFAIYPTIGRICGEHLHVKTAGTSYLEALRAVCRTDKGLFREIVAFSRGRFATDKASYHISVTDDDVAQMGKENDGDLERTYLDATGGRQLLHVTFGSVLNVGQRANGQSFREAILGLLHSHSALHHELLAKHLGKHIRLLEG